MIAPPPLEEEGFAPLPLRSLPAKAALPFRLYLRVKTRDQPLPAFVLCCPQGEVFKGELRDNLKRLKISWVYFEAGQEGAVFDFLFARLQARLARERRGHTELVGLAYDTTLMAVRRLFQALPDGGKEAFQPVLPLVGSLLKVLDRENYWPLVMQVMRHDQGLYTHSLNTCLLGLGFVIFFGWSELQAQAFGVGALLHDLGMAALPQAILQKAGHLSEEEMEQVRQHPTRGFRLLKDTALVMRNPLLMVLQHHENADGSGYPQGLTLKSIHPWARVLRIVDSYEAMTSPRPWRGVRSTREALWSIREGLGDRQIYDPQYFAAFVKFLAERQGE